MTQKNITVGVTAFLDILGFGNRVLNAKSVADVDAIVKDVKTIQRHFDYKPTDPTVKKVQKHYKKTILAFSDSVIVNVPVQSAMTKSQGVFDAVMSELSSMSLAQVLCINDGLFLRGGVDIGWWYQRGATLASQSMVRAYKMEGQANVPVIALTDELYKFLAKSPGRAFYAADIDPVKKLFKKYKSTEPNAKVSFWYLDYIATAVDSIDWFVSKTQYKQYMAASSEDRGAIMDSGYKQNLEGWFRQHARTIEAAHQRAESIGVKSKYEWLSAYHNSSAKRYTTAEGTQCAV